MASFYWPPQSGGGGGSGITSIGTIDSQTPAANGATISGTALYLQSASSTAPGLVNLVAQTFAGNKTFTGTITASNFSGSSSGSNTGDVTLGTMNGLSISAQVLSLAAAGTSTTGALSSTDWNTFNSKGAGSVTSVGFSVPATTIFTATGSPVTGSGTLGFTVTGVSGGIPYFDSTSTLHTSSILTANQLLVGGGAGSSPAILGTLGTTTTVLHGNASGAPTFGAVSLTADVSGVLPLANGGTNANLTASNGAIPYSSASAIALLAPGSSGNLLTSGGAGAPTWSTATQVTASLNLFSATLKGLAPLSGGGTTNFLRADGAWAAPGGGGSLTAPTIQKFTSSSGTYTTPTSPAPLYIRVEMVGAGGGGTGSGPSGIGTPGDGGNTTFGSSLLVANGGTGGIPGGNSGPAGQGAGGVGGTASLGSGPVGLAISGGNGAPNEFLNNTLSTGGTTGGSSYFGGAGQSAVNAAGTNAQANTGSGGGGAGIAGINVYTGSSGGAGGYVNAIITSPLSSYAYVVGALGAGGTAGSGGLAGGNGAAGIILVTEYYQ